MNQVPFIDLTRSYSEIRKTVLNDWEGCFDRCEFIGGPSVAELESRLTKRLQTPHTVTCANGTDALILGLQAIGVRPGDRVALPNLTFWATYEAVVQVGAVPVLIDIDSDDLQMSYEELQVAHERFGLKAAILVHLFGWASKRLSEFRQFCAENSILLLEDGAQCFGVQVKSRSVFADAASATLSFYPAKVFGGVMDGGAFATQNPEIANTFRTLCNHGRKDHYSYSHVGWNSRMGALQARFLCQAESKIDSLIESRKRAFRFYEEFFKNNRYGIHFFTPPTGVEGNGYLTVLTCEGNSGIDLQEKLKAYGIGSARTYPETVDMQAPARSSLRVSNLDKSRQFCQTVINLPLFAGIREDECQASAEALVRAITK